MSRKREDHLEQWTVWLRDALAARGKPARLAYDDKLAGDVMVLAIDSGERDRLVEITVARRPKGRAHLTVVATTLDGAGAAHEAMAKMHAEISRLANAKRKFVHRIGRLLGHLVEEWAQRDQAAVRDEALARLRAVLPEAVAMTGVGFHVELAGADDHHTRDVYPSVYGAAVMVDGRWRGLALDPETRRWLVRAGTLNALTKARPNLDLDTGGIGLIEAAALGGVAAAALAATALTPAETEVKRKSEDSSWCEWGDVFDPWELVGCSSGADLGNCVPDCGCDLGGLDCSL